MAYKSKIRITIEAEIPGKQTEVHIPRYLRYKNGFTVTSQVGEVIEVTDLGVDKQKGTDQKELMVYRDIVISALGDEVEKKNLTIKGTRPTNWAPYYSVKISIASSTYTDYIDWEIEGQFWTTRARYKKPEQKLNAANPNFLDQLKIITLETIEEKNKK